MTHYLFTSESVSIGHPDKIADQISDAILDACLEVDPHARVACETMVTRGLVVLAGEMTTCAAINFQEVVRQTIKDIGYVNPALGFDYRSCGIISCIHQQSPDIARGINEAQNPYQEQGAGDQGIMFGYACDETPVYMPLPIALAHQIIRTLREKRESGLLPYLGPDAKTQVTIEYDEEHRPVHLHTVVISTQHAEGISQETIAEEMKKLVKEVSPPAILNENTLFYINPTGRFVIGGPESDCGLTGRKIIVDTYGGMGRHGGGAFSGKDPSKVDRSGSYAARYIAKNIVAAKLAKRCEVQLSYAIGVPYPISIKVDTFGTGTISEDLLSRVIPLVFQLTPKGMVQMLDLKKPIYRKTAFEGHFGRSDPNFTWERTDRVEALLLAIKHESFLSTQNHSKFPPTLSSAPSSHQKMEGAFRKEKEVLQRQLARELKKLQKKELVYAEHLKECATWPTVQREGELIKTNLAAIKRGQASVTLRDWSTDELVSIALDPRKTPKAEMEVRFKKARKLQAGIPHLTRLYNSVKEEIQQNITKQQQIERAVSSEELTSFKPAHRIGPKAQQQIVKTLSPIYREFCSASGIKIWVGKNARANDQLTFHLANGRDGWLHTMGCAGSHVVIRLAKGQEADPETIQDALQLALYFSKAREKGEGEILFTQRKHVSKGRKGKTGEAQVSHYRTIWVRLDLERIQSIKKISTPRP